MGGVSFHGGKIQAVAIEDRSNDRVARLMREVEYDFPNDAWRYPSQVPDEAAKLTDALSSAFNTDNVPQKISVALPSDAALLLATPLDPTLDPRELRKQVDWELSNYHKGPATRKLVSNYVSLEKFGNKETKEILIVALQRSILHLLRTACECLKTRLHIVDIEHFCVEPALVKSQPNTRKQNVLLIGNKKNRTEVSLVAQSRLSRYRYGYGSTELQKLEVIKNFIGECQSANVTLQAAFLYGDALENLTFTTLQSFTRVPIQYVDPGSIVALRFEEHSCNIRNGTKHPSRFAPCIGVTMREA